MSDKRHKQLSWTAVLVSVLTGAGGTYKAHLDSRNTDQFRYVIAKEVAANEVRYDHTQGEIARILEHHKELRQANQDLRLAVELLTLGMTTSARESLPEALATHVPHVAPELPKPEPDYIQQKQAELFEAGN